METPKSPHPLDPLVQKLRQWTTLDAREGEAVHALPYQLQRVDAGDFIVRDGERPTRSCLLISGYAFRQKLVADGGRSISAIHLRGDMVDLQSSFLGVADHSVQALTRCSVAFIPRDAVKELAFSFPKVGMALWCDTLVDSSIFREWLANIGRRDAASRIAHLLCEFGVRFEAAGLGEKLAYELPMTQEQLADCTGLTSVHVNRTLKSLEASGDITRSMRHVAIADWEKISSTADFESEYLHLAADRAIAA